MARALPDRRQLLLFLVAVVLPSTVLVGVGLRLISQERELQLSRLADDRRTAVAEAGLAVRGALADAEADALALLRSDGVLVASRAYANPAIRLVARVEDGLPLLPWEDDPALTEARRGLSRPEFAALMREGQRAEIGAGDAGAATRAYRRAVAIAESESERALARLLTARALASVDREASMDLYLEILGLPGEVMDENGVPVALYAAARLGDWGVTDSRIQERLDLEARETRWRTPGALYLLADLLTPEGGRPPEALEALRVQTEHARQLAGEYAVLAASRLDPGETGPEWSGVGGGGWLARAIGPPDSPPVGVVAVSIGALIAALDLPGSGVEGSLGPLEITLADPGGGTPLGVSRPDLSAVFNESLEPAAGPFPRLRTAFYVTALLLVIGVTLLGGYLLLHDMERETRMVRLRSDFVASVSHELKTPLTAIRMFAETLRDRESADPELRADYLDTIVGESERLTRLINNVLDLSRIEQGQKTYERTPSSLPEITRRAARAVEYPLSLEGFRLSMDIDEGLPPVTVDADSVEQAVLNLLTNAMKYSGTSREIDLSLGRQNGHAVISVRDAGVGVSTDELPRLTEKFYRASSRENDRVPGTGLGLTIVDHTARAHGGHVTAQSQLGEGSTFSIHIPLEAAQ